MFSSSGAMGRGAMGSMEFVILVEDPDSTYYFG